MKDKIALTLLLTGGVLCGDSFAQVSLPVYQVVKPGLTDPEITRLSTHLLLPSARLRSVGGRLTALDTTKFLAFPHMEAKGSPDLAKLRATTPNKAPAVPIKGHALDLVSLGKLIPLDEKVALDKASSSLQVSGLAPQFGTPLIGHHQLTLLSKNTDGSWGSKLRNLDTSVIYKFTEPNGVQMVGPGAQVQFTFDEKGAVSRFHYSASQLRAGQSVQLIAPTEVDRRVLTLAPAGATVSKKLVYWCPPLEPWIGGVTKPATTIIPYYAYTTHYQVKNPTTGAISNVQSRIKMLPATDDRRYVPAVTVMANAIGAKVTAKVSIVGGVAPYTIVWGGSDPRISTSNQPTITYTAQRRWDPAFSRELGISLDRTETVSATVIDANGVTTTGSVEIPVKAIAYDSNTLMGSQPSTLGLFADMNHPAPAALENKPTFGCYNPADPGEWTCCRVGWQAGMFSSGAGAGTQKFCWTGDDAWPGDFAEPKPAGSLMSQPWLNGDADYSNYGINTADLVLHIGDGCATGFTMMQPGAPLSKYATGWVSSPAYTATMRINGNGYGTPVSKDVNYDNSWGPTGPNDTLDWLLMDDCDTLDVLDSNNLNVAQRWGPAFNGLHVFTGFSTTENGSGQFEHDVADNLLGVHGAPKTIVQSWFDSAMTNNTGDPCAMGPVAQVWIFSISDMDDYYWGKGEVGPTIVPSKLPAGTVSYWYLRGTNPVSLLLP